MTTNTNTTARTTARYAATAAPIDGLFGVIDRTDGSTVVSIKGRQAARDTAKALNVHATDAEPQPRLTVVPDAKPAKKAKAAKPAEAQARTSHVDCAHASTKMARAICRRERAKADATN